MFIDNFIPNKKEDQIKTIKDQIQKNKERP
jgi:hypothetical protein